MNNQTDNLFTVLERGDRKIQHAHKKAIILVGLTRAGKSTVYNWFLNKPMVGRGKLNSFFETINEDKDVAKMSNKFVSMTLDPNMKINFTQDTSLIDMAGFLDSRDHVGVIGVSYFLKAIFEQVRKAKFVLVFDQNRFREQSGKGITDTFNGFIDMFHYDKLSPELKGKLKKSLAVVVTRSRNPQDHYGYMEEVIGKLKEPELQNIRNKEIVIELLQSVMDLNHVEEFKAAKDNQSPGECKIIDHLTNKMGWDFFDFDDADSYIGESFISLPIAKDFEKLEQKQKQKYSQTIKNRLNAYKLFSDINKLLVDTFLKNWSVFLEEWKENRVIRPNHTHMKGFFEEVERFLVNNDLYNSEETVSVEFKANYDPPTFISTVGSIIKIFQCSAKLAQIITEVYTVPELMTGLSQAFVQLLSNFRPFCSSSEEEKLIARVKYIIERGFIEFTRLDDLQPGTVNEFKLYLNDSCQLDIRDQEFMEKIIMQISSDLMTKLFNTFELIEEYEAFLTSYEQRFGEIQSQRCAIQISKGDLLFRSGERTKALLCYSSAIKTYLRLALSVTSSNKDPNDIDQELKELYIKKIKLTQKIKEILVELPETDHFNPHSYALQLCSHYNLIDDTCQVYDIILASSNVSPVRKCKVYEDYATYCSFWGRNEKALALLQKKLSLEADEAGYFATIDLICNLDNDRDTKKVESLNKLREKRWLDKDDQLENILGEIEVLVPQDAQEAPK